MNIMFDSKTDKIAWELLEKIDVRDRKKGFRTFKDVFVGSQAVDFLVANQNISREEAVRYGQDFLREGLFEHVGSGRAVFTDGTKYYRFTRDAKRMHQLSIWGRSHGSHGSPTLPTPTPARQQDPQPRLFSSQSSFQSSFQFSTTNMSTDTSSIAELKVLFCQGVKVEDRKHRFKTYTHCFLGSEAVDFLCASQNQTREEAVQMGQKIMDEGAFYHITHDHRFEDAPLLYRLTDCERRYSESGSSAGGRVGLRKISSFRSAGNQQQQRQHRYSNASSDIAFELQRKVSVGNHSHLSVIYKDCFVGSAAVDVLVFVKPSLDRHDAVSLGQTIMDDGIFQSADGEATFEDDPYRFYRFVDCNGKPKTASSRRLKNALGNIAGSFRQRRSFQNSGATSIDQNSRHSKYSRHSSADQHSRHSSAERVHDRQHISTARVRLDAAIRNGKAASSDEESSQSSSVDDYSSGEDVSIHLSGESEVASSISSNFTFETSLPMNQLENEDKPFQPPPLIKQGSLTAAHRQNPTIPNNEFSRAVNVKDEIAVTQMNSKKAGKTKEQGEKSEGADDEEDSFDRKIAQQQQLKFRRANVAATDLEGTKKKPSDEIDTAKVPSASQGVPSVVSAQPSVCETNVSRQTDPSGRETALQLQSMTEKLEKLTSRVQKRSKVRQKEGKAADSKQESNSTAQTSSEASSSRDTAILEEAISDLQKKIGALTQEQPVHKNPMIKLSMKKAEVSEEGDAKQTTVAELKG